MITKIVYNISKLGDSNFARYLNSLAINGEICFVYDGDRYIAGNLCIKNSKLYYRNQKISDFRELMFMFEYGQQFLLSNNELLALQDGLMESFGYSLSNCNDHALMREYIPLYCENCSFTRDVIALHDSPNPFVKPIAIDLNIYKHESARVISQKLEHTKAIFNSGFDDMKAMKMLLSYCRFPLYAFVASDDLAKLLAEEKLVMIVQSLKRIYINKEHGSYFKNLVFTSQYFNFANFIRRYPELVI